MLEIENEHGVCEDLEIWEDFMKSLKYTGTSL